MRRRWIGICWTTALLALVPIAAHGADRSIATAPRSVMVAIPEPCPPPAAQPATMPAAAPARHLPTAKHVPPDENRYVHVPPGKERFHAVPVPAYPWLTHGEVVPTYNWGYFGARYQPRTVEQQTYYGDACQWSFRPGW